MSHPLRCALPGSFGTRRQRRGVEFKSKFTRLDGVKGHRAGRRDAAAMPAPAPREQREALCVRGVFADAGFTYFCCGGLPYLGKQQELCLL